MTAESEDAWDGGDASAVSSSRSRFRVVGRPARGGETSEAVDEATEATGLLGAGARGWDGLDDFEGLPWWKRPSPWFLLGPFCVFTLAFGGSMVPRMNLIVNLVCQRYFSDKASHDPKFTFTPILFGDDNPQCFIPAVQKGVATFVLVINVITGLLSAVTAPQLGALSDRYGRKRLMVLASFGGVAAEVITILTATFPNAMHYNWLILGAVFDGLAGSFTAGSLLIHAYVSDCTPPSRRSVIYGYMHACLFIGLAVGPLLAAFLVKETGSLLSIFYLALAFHLFFMLFIWFVVPESMSRKRQLLAREKHARDWVRPVLPWPVARLLDTVGGKDFSDAAASVLLAGNVTIPLRILFPPGVHNRRVRRNLVTLALVDMVVLGAAMSSGPVLILYVESQFGWRTPESSLFTSLLSTVRVVVLLAIFPVIDRFFRARSRKRAAAAIAAAAPAGTLADGDEREAAGSPVTVVVAEKNVGADQLDVWILRVALFSDVLGLTGYIFARSVPLFVMFGVFTAFGGLGSATIQAVITKHVPSERVGQLLGAIGVLNAMARVWSPMLFNGVYAATVETYPQAFFVLLAGMFGLALFGTFLVRPYVFMEEPEGEASNPPPKTAGTRSDSLLGEVLEDEQFAPGM